MCEDTKQCLIKDQDFKAWICEVVQDDAKSSIITKIASIVLLILTKYSYEILEFIKRGLE